MAAATSADIKTLRDRTGAGMLDCKKALTETGDMEKAIDWLKAKGMAKAASKAGRLATEGTVASYIHAGGKIGVLVEVNCETDFASQTEKFQAFVKDVCMHIAAAAPEYVTRDQVPQDAFNREKGIQIARVMEEGKPQNIAEKIVEGRMGKWYEEVCLLDQKFVKDDTKTIAQLVQEAVAGIGENIQVRRFSRFVLGEGLEKKSTDFAAEVAATAARA
jgi:elongation factor Ts